jgi:hypothetical protein
MSAHLIEDPQILEDLEGLVTRLRKRMHAMGSGAYTGWSADELARALAGAGRDLETHDAVDRILTGLVDESPSPAFWGTALGRACAYWGTGKLEAVTRACAAAALGCTRQNIGLMMRDGRLSEPVNAGTDDLVSTASLAHAMRSRNPMRRRTWTTNP